VIVDANVSASAGIVDTKLGTILTSGKVANSATTATSANTANAIVARDSSGNFSASLINKYHWIRCKSNKHDYKCCSYICISAVFWQCYKLCQYGCWQVSN